MTTSIQTGRAYAQAKALAHYYLTIEPVQQVRLFGSVASTSNGNCKHDIDLILVVNRDLFESFVDQLNLRIDGRPLYIVAQWLLLWCREIVEELLKAPLISQLPETTIDYPVDILLLPIGWEDNPKKIARLTLPLRDRFLVKLGKYSRLFDSPSGDFLPPRGK